MRNRRARKKIWKNGTSDSLEDWFAVGEYKKLPNDVGGQETTAPDKVANEMRKLLKKYRARKVLDLHDLLAFHYEFEKIHPFQDGNDRYLGYSIRCLLR